MINQNINNRQRGFTIIELLVGITLFTVLAAVTIGLQSLIFRGSDFGITTALTIDNANEVLNGIVNELRKAKESDNGAFPLETALEQEIVFYSNIDNDEDIERVRYYLEGTELKKGIIQPTSFPISYPSENENITTIANYIQNGSNPLFQYYNQDWPEDQLNNPLVVPPPLNEVTLVKISVRVNAETDLPESELLLESSVQIRRLKTNL